MHVGLLACAGVFLRVCRSLCVFVGLFACLWVSLRICRSLCMHIGLLACAEVSRTCARELSGTRANTYVSFAASIEVSVANLSACM